MSNRKTPTNHAVTRHDIRTPDPPPLLRLIPVAAGRLNQPMWNVAS
ncbi:hypothetical protein [Nonomuraea sp. NPDC050643]